MAISVLHSRSSQERAFWPSFQRELTLNLIRDIGNPLGHCQVEQMKRRDLTWLLMESMAKLPRDSRLKPEHLLPLGLAEVALKEQSS